MKRLTLMIFVAAGIMVSCKDKKDAPVTPRDKSITPANSFSELFLDSTVLENFIAARQFRDSIANRLRSFYNSRNYQYAWFFDDGLAPYATTFKHMQDEYIAYSRDSSLYNPRLQQVIDTFSKKNGKFKFDSAVLNAELLFTSQFFRYSSRAYGGKRSVDVQDLGWYIPRKRIEPGAFLDSLIRNKGGEVSQYEPVNRQYNLLKNYLVKYYDLEKQGGWDSLNESSAVSAIKRRLRLTGDFTAEDSSNTMTDSLKLAIKSFQQRCGLPASGAINKSLINALNVPVTERIRQLLINMERIRWVPAQPPANYLMVNIPEFRLHVYEKNELAWSSNVVVGSTAHNTVIFSGTLQYIVFSPYWNIPTSIYKNEVVPGMARDKNYLAKHNMEKTATGVRQKPGTSNALGLVKFLFPNSYDIYFHDTPSKSLFREDARAFSHGCIRLSEPRRLAQWLLRKDAGWDSTSIVSAMNGGKERFVTLKEKLPVFICYFTSWVDRDGKINFRRDIYGHDEKMAAHLFMEEDNSTAN